MLNKSSKVLVSGVSLAALSAPVPAQGLGTGGPSGRTAEYDLTAVSLDSATDGWAVGRLGDCCTGTPYARHWDGSRWHGMTLPNGTEDDRLQSVDARSASDVWAVGYSVYGDGEDLQTLVEHWDGHSWSMTPSPNPVPFSDTLYSVSAVGPDDVWAVGYAGNGSQEASLILHWDGQQWTVVDHPDPKGGYLRLTGVTSLSANDVWAVGSRSRSARSRALIEHWDGTAWTIVRAARNTVGEWLNGVWANGPDDIWAVGDTFDNGVDDGLVEHWDGHSWSLVKQHPSTGLRSVSGTGGNDVWAVGFTAANAGSILHWDGSAWSLVSSPAGDHRLYGVSAASSNEAIAVGHRWSAPGAITIGWNGSAWTTCHRTCG